MTRLGIPDLLATGPQETEELAHTTASHSPTLHRVLRALAGAGVLEQVGPRRFALAALGTALRADVPGSLRPAVLMHLAEWNWRPWGQLLQTVRSGETAFRLAHGSSLFDYLAQHPEAAAAVDAAQSELTAVQAPAIAAVYDFALMRVVVDVGGRAGRLLAAILQRYPKLRGILFDLPHVAERARSLIEAEGLVNRCTVVAGDFFRTVADDGDAYILRNIVHDWDDEQAVTILTNCRRAMAKGGRVLLVERPLVEPYAAENDSEALPALFADLEMLVNVGGQERVFDSRGRSAWARGYRSS